MAKSFEHLERVIPQPTPSTDDEIKAEAEALSKWASHRDVQFPALYQTVVTEYQALLFGEAAVPFGNFGRWVHAQPISMFVFRVDERQPLRRPGRSIEGNVSDLGTAVGQLIPPSQDSLRDALVPFAGDSHGWFCLDFSFARLPPVVFFDPERDWHANPSSGLRYVAESFDAFLDRLEYPNEHGEYQTPAGSRHIASHTQLSWDSYRDRVLFGTDG